MDGYLLTGKSPHEISRRVCYSGDVTSVELPSAGVFAEGAAKIAAAPITAHFNE